MFKIQEVLLGNTKQFISISGDEKKPIVLYLHGGPGMAQIGFAHKYQKDWEENFLVVNWDQRGSGLSFSEELSTEDMNLEQMVSDTLELVEYLLKEFNQPKLILVGHSWGSILGLEAIKKKPDYFYSFVSVSQVVNMNEANAIAYEFVLKTARERNDLDTINELLAMNIQNGLTKEEEALIQERVMEFRGLFFNMDDIGYLFQEPHTLGVYTIEDTAKWGKGIAFSNETLGSALEGINFKETIHSVEIPVYFATGKHDYCTPTSLIHDYYRFIEAPHKEFVIFENSAHGLVFEEPEKFNELLIEVKNNFIK